MTYQLVMTTTQRTSITPQLNQLIFDKTLNRFYLGDGSTVGGNAASSVAQGTFYLSAGSNVTVPLFSSSRRMLGINGLFNLKTSSGTITAGLQINGTNITGLAGLSVTSTPQSPSASGANTVNIGDRVTLVLSSNSSALDLEFTMQNTPL